ncbi:DUF1127 domain-containing protein [Actibacterium sp. XHP0104]|uniref:DUF1127 domain-containing protein n=1 Tax=Actibacterium sp. XHP0104 TaxID=2984335 RepID=UPI0021E9778F|nr:DUF1127 domain-containing protein [Actibacterium sp. XHP0104]MCV2880745.1 DUF1127 domain-containing protein [Actibacterium sp. XHP0104]
MELVNTTHGFNISALFAGVGRLFVKMGEASPAYKRVEQLNKLSDAELAEIGLTREEAVMRLFNGRCFF